MTTTARLFLSLALALFMAVLIGPVWPRRPGAAGPTELYSQDFEGTDNCAADGSDVDTGSPDCQYTTESIGATGTESAIMPGLTDAAVTAALWSDDIDPACTSGTCRAKFKFQGDVDAGNSTTTAFTLRDGATTVLYFLYDCGPGNPDIKVTCIDATGVWDEVIEGTTYNVCLEYDLDNDDGVVYVDTGSDWCIGTTATSSCDDTITNNTNIDGFRLVGEANEADLIFDDIVIEQE